MSSTGYKNSDELRQGYIDYFAGLEHTIVSSSPLIPKADKTLLFTNAGMNQFKDVLLGIEERDYKRAASCQLCIRAGGKHNDLDAVGKDGRHNTLFEMLGNWSFGDYWKRGAIEMAWRLVVDHLKFPTERVYATVYKTDEEAYDIWAKEIGVPEERIVRLGDIEKGDEENFWSMGPTGPCGPCSELYYDLGPEVGCGKSTCAPGCDCDRYSEFWNLVFMEMDRAEDGTMTPLKFQSVDTGLGFERTVGVLQGVTSVFDTDNFVPLVEAVRALAAQERETPKLTKESCCVISDHIRCLAFTVAEGAVFANEGRGYVLRRILRRAMRHGLLLGLNEPFLFKLVEAVVAKLGHVYPYLGQRHKVVSEILREEEQRFVETLEKGMGYFEDLVARTEANQGAIIDGREVFKLHDTFGFPPDLTEIMAEERGLRVDTDTFDQAMEAQRERSKSAAKFYDAGEGEGETPWTEVVGGEGTEFVGYTELESEAKVRRFRTRGGRLEVVVDRSPVYVEKGGQQSDQGWLRVSGQEIRINDAVDQGRNVILLCEPKGGVAFKADQPITIVVDQERRAAIARSHTATHLLHWALRKHLGDRVTQAGSSVGADAFTFDFRHGSRVDESDLALIQEAINAQILANSSVSTTVKPYSEAVNSGAMALFEEEYGDEVRVVEIGDGFSRELCGGTHVARTGDIGSFIVDSEKSTSAGVRRITARTGERAFKKARTALGYVDELCSTLTVSEDQITSRVQELLEENKALRREVAQLKQGDAADRLKSELSTKIVREPLPHFVAVVSGSSMDEIRRISDTLAGEANGAVLLLANVAEEKTSFLVRVPDVLISKKVSAGNLLRTVAQGLGGRGGGKANLATGGVGRVVEESEFRSLLKDALAAL